MALHIVTNVLDGAFPLVNIWPSASLISSGPVSQLDTEIRSSLLPGETGETFDYWRKAGKQTGN